MKAFFPGSFNPFTKGHADIVDRLLAMGWSVVIGIGTNPDKPESRATAEANLEKIRRIYSDSRYEGRVSVVAYEGLSAEKAADLKADCMVRGVRSATDFDYEYALASANRQAFGIETLLVPADPSLAFISSSIVRELEGHGRADIASKYTKS